MKLTKLSYRKAVLVNIGNYENVRVEGEAEVTFDINDSNTFNDAQNYAVAIVDEQLRSEVLKVKGLGAWSKRRRNRNSEACDIEDQIESLREQKEVTDVLRRYGLA